MATGQSSRVVSASLKIAAEPGRIFELIADLAQQSRWDGNENRAEASARQRVRRVGEVFTMTLTHDGAIREDHVVEFECLRLVTPSSRCGPSSHWRRVDSL
jgi:uncharacterized protein YndB with AHSA1/START domain